MLLFPGSKAIMLGFQASSSQNSCVTDRPNAKRKKKGKGWGEGMAQDSEDQLPVDINFSSTEIKK